ncbi:MAG: hypothetical protein ACK4NB_03795 [Fimbriimonadales bacterium]
MLTRNHSPFLDAGALSTTVAVAVRPPSTTAGESAVEVQPCIEAHDACSEQRLQIA